MKHYKKENRYVSIVTVHVPSAEALIDMMRYDRCCPHTEDEARKIQRLITDWRVDGPGESKPIDHIVRLLRFSVNPDSATHGRWHSFGCRVLDERNPEDSPLSDAEALNLAKIS